MPRSNNGNGYVGVGWDLEFGAIERSAVNGIDYGGDKYVLRMAGAAIEMIYDASMGFYRAKIEGGFYRIKKFTTTDGFYWEVTDKKGTRYLFGQGRASRQDDPLNPTHIFKWCLDYVVDTNGSSISYSYVKDILFGTDNGFIYPDSISYSGSRINFHWQIRTDAPDMYSTDFRVKNGYRLQTIEVIGPYGTRLRGV